MTTADQPRSGSQAVERAVHLLNCFEGDDPELSISELAHVAGVPVSTAHRLAQALVRGRRLEQDPATDRYRIGQGLATLARPALNRLGIDAAAPHMYALAAGIQITTSLSVADAREAVTVLQARPPVRFCTHQLPRARQPLGSSASGRALLAHRPVPAYPAADLDLVRRKGFAVEEFEGVDDHIRSVAVPVFGADKQVWGALSVQARSARLNDELVRDILPAMHRIAVRIGGVVQNASAAAIYPR
ncbi:IclR family transcriptional regulator [Nocardia tenerifensis]|uniref:IclR family transcriptional regulator n=1 Tax=Nocardia tenerifensis TaxID=228006 RepID=A0A318KE68_9NOCA|nr:helix-turn-helix domain-containing protein [Nocardia tenerifensis]PXX64281.1 IclR family transcriptional regulator [Nocardia tenerifensis]